MAVVLLSLIIGITIGIGATSIYNNFNLDKQNDTTQQSEQTNASDNKEENERY